MKQRRVIAFRQPAHHYHHHSNNPAIVDGLLPLEVKLSSPLPELDAPPNRRAWETCLHQLFELQAARTPDAIAVVLDDNQLTYTELNSRANDWATVLRERGVGPEVLVGLCVERSLEMVIGILAILKAGGAYVPLDPTYPPERLALLLEDARPPVLLTQKRLVAQLPPYGAAILCLDAPPESPRPGQTSAPVTASNLAYVIYTSGSTGKPKGVAVTHHNVVRLFASTQPWFHFNQDDTWTLFHSFAFDFSVWELFGALLHGGRLVIVPHLVSRSPRPFLELLLRERVTVLNQTPSAFRLLLRAEQTLPPGEKLPLRLIIFGGEMLEPHMLKPWFDRHDSRSPQLVNMYGITETTVHVTYRPLSSADLGQPSTIGVPIPDLQVHLLDDQLRQVETGVAGELCVSGPGLARGYLRSPDLTAQKFIPHPFNREPGARLYRSGDLARRLPNGDLEYLGRIDQQVKIRGHRVELGEIEAALAGHPSVRESVAVRRADAPGDPKLVAYVVSRPGELPDVSTLRNFLSRKLPACMIPDAFVWLASMPLTINGKLDRAALPAPAARRPDLAQSYAEPRTDLEHFLAGIWRTVLNLDRVGIHDRFFELGGHSMQAAEVIAQIDRKLGERVFLIALFEAPTIADLALYLHQHFPEAVKRVFGAHTGVSVQAPLDGEIAREAARASGRELPSRGTNNANSTGRSNRHTERRRLRQAHRQSRSISGRTHG